MGNGYRIPESSQEDSWYEREDRCRKNLKTVTKAILMRLFVTGILFWVAVRTAMEVWVIGLIAFVMIINLTGLLPLGKEWCRCRKELNEILAEE